ncbi:MAG: DUF3791 domain-containing protein [Bacteroidales bacterium]|nr:DUF3791 domain-containing protein [Bacteroidales bacterium]
MEEKLQILYMQMRLVRMAAKKWKMSIPEAANFFALHGVFRYIEDFFGLFHVEGDAAIFDDIKQYLKNKGVKR